VVAAAGLAYDRAMEVEVRFHPSGRRLRVRPGTTLLEAVRRAGLPLASACGAARICGRCGLRILAGADALSRETDEETRAKERNRIGGTLRLACCTEIQAGPVEVTTRYW
jgi:ferredoxin